MKYIKMILISALLLIAVGTQDIYAAEGSVTTDGVRIRKEPNTDSAIVTVLNKSAKVEIISETGDWYKVKYTLNEVYEGYMKKEFVSTSTSAVTNQTPATPTTSTPTPTPTSIPTPSPTPVAAETPATQTPTENPVGETNQKITTGENVTNTIAKLYALPTVSSSIKEEIKADATVTVQEIAGKFAYIKYNNSCGWIRISSLKQKTIDTSTPTGGSNNTTTSSTSTTTSTEKKGYVSVNSAIVRASASTNSEMVASLGYNAEITIIGQEEDFYKIRINNREAYIAMRLVSDTIQTTNRSLSEPRQSTPIVENTDTTPVAETKPEVTAVQTSTVPKSSVGEQMAEMAKKYIGYKYVYGGANPNSGFDCSGLVYYICGQLGYSVSRTADYQANNGVHVEKANLQLGDLVFFSNYKTNTGIGHVGIYIGNNQFVHASTATTGVIVSSLNEAEYVRRYITACRIGV